MTDTDTPHVLLVEDEFLIRLTLAEALQDAGFVVSEAETGEQALAVLRDGADVGVLLTDIQLPGKMSGLELAQAARQSRPSLRVIYVTGRPDTVAGTNTSSREALITKPYLPSEVISTVRRLVA
ncbi:MAG: response regulator [Acetobacteraceae bacterium]|nr:response regulator [Acetobacteraceae bacterium]MBV8525360.1 response regulator [Acetobacteraceae bacterium]MBV8590960.1 response regulator [Acetobacteraceae bacterium]